MRKITQARKERLKKIEEYLKLYPETSKTKIQKLFGESKNSDFLNQRTLLGQFKHFYEEDKCWYKLDPEEYEAVEWYLSNPDVTKADVRRKYGYKHETFDKKLKVLGHDTTPKYKVVFNRQAFSEMKTEEDAYWLGFLLADGYNNQNRGTITLKLGKIDEGHLVKFCNYMKVDPQKRIMDDYGGSNQIIKYVNLNSRELSSTLASYGVVQGKSGKEEYYQLENHLVRHYLRGIFDGDGGFVNNTKKGIIDRVQIVGSEKLLFNFKREIENAIGMEINPIYPKDSIYTLTISGIEKIQKTTKFLYENSTIFLDRKYKQYKQLQQQKSGRV